MMKRQHVYFVMCHALEHLHYGLRVRVRGVMHGEEDVQFSAYSMTMQVKVSTFFSCTKA